MVRRREAASLTAHYVAGVLDWPAMEDGLRVLSELTRFSPGDRVRTLRGSASGVIIRLLDDGRVVWRPDGATMDIFSLPESLVPVSEKKNFSS